MKRSLPTMYIQSVGTEGGIIVPLKIMWQRHSRWLVVYRMNKMNYPLVAIVIPTLNEALLSGLVWILFSDRTIHSIGLTLWSWTEAAMTKLMK